MTRLLTNCTTSVGTFAVAGGTCMMGANIGATQVTVVVNQTTFTGSNSNYIARLYQTNTTTFNTSSLLASSPTVYGGGAPGPTYTINYTGIVVTEPYLWAWFNMNTGGTGQWLVQSVDDNFSGAYCAGGVQLQSGASFLYYLTPGLIDVWLGAVGLAWVAPFLTALWFSTLDAQSLCTALPPPMPSTIPFNPDELSLDGANQLLRAIAWQNVCQCSGSGTPPPPPTASEPTGTPALPTEACSNSNVCATLQDIWQDLAMTQKTVNYVRDLVQSIQRYGVPFAYVAGTAQTGLSGSGTFTVSRAVGFQVVLTATPDLLILPGNPVYVWDAGWLSVSDPDGMLEEKRLTRQSMTWLPEQAQLATSFNYQLNPGVEMSVVPLLAEP